MQSDQNRENQEIYQGRWLNDQHLRFLQGVMMHGKDWKIIETLVRTRNGSQVRSHAQKFFIKLNKINKDRRKGKNKDLSDPTEIQQEILDHFSEQDITENTPSQFANLLKRDWSVAIKPSLLNKTQRKIKRRNQISRLTIGTRSLQNQIKEEANNEENSQKDLQSESFFTKLMRCMGMRNNNAEIFYQNLQLYDFVNGVDPPKKSQPSFTNKQKIVQQIAQNNDPSQSHDENKIRRKSFTLPDSEEDDAKLRGLISSVHRGQTN